MYKVLIVSLIAAVLFVFPATSIAESDTNICAKVMKMEGNLLVDNKPAKLKAKIKSGDVIKTGEKSNSIIKLNDKSVIMLKSDTSIKIMKTGKKNYEVVILSGKALMVFKPFSVFSRKRPGGKDRYQIRTSTAVAGVRGTGLYVSVEDENKVYLCVCFGKVDYTAIADPTVKRTVKADHHGAVYVTQTDNSASIEDAPMKDHSDEEVDNLIKLQKEKF